MLADAESSFPPADSLWTRSLQLAESEFAPSAPAPNDAAVLPHEDTTDSRARADAEFRSAMVKIAWAAFICTVFMAGEFVGGVASGSLAVIADASHLLIDSVGFYLSLFFLWYGHRNASPRLSYGMKRAEILGSLLNIALIWLVSGALSYEAVVRMIEIVNRDPGYQPVIGWLMFLMACLAVGANLVIALCLGGGSGHGHAHGTHGHAHGHGHSAPEPVPISGTAVRGTLAIVDTRGGERMRFMARGGALNGGELVVAIARPGGRTETLLLVPDRRRRVFTSEVAPAEPHEFQAVLRWTGQAAAGAEEHRFSMHEPGGAHEDTDEEQGHGHSHDHGHSHHNAAPQTRPKDNPCNCAQWGKHGNINVSTSLAHAFSHIVQDTGIVIAGALIWAYPASAVYLVQLADPIATLVFNILGLVPTFGVIRVSVRVLMEAVPDDMDPSTIQAALLRVAGVTRVHDLHIWALTVGQAYATAHVEVGDDARSTAVLNAVHEELLKHDIAHATIQIEAPLASRAHHKRNVKCHAY